MLTCDMYELNIGCGVWVDDDGLMRPGIVEGWDDERLTVQVGFSDESLVVDASRVWWRYGSKTVAQTLYESVFSITDV